MFEGTPDPTITELFTEWQRDGALLRATLLSNITKWSGSAPLLADPIDDLDNLVTAHYRAISNVSSDFGVSVDVEQRWLSSGIEHPPVNLAQRVIDAYTLGTLEHESLEKAGRKRRSSSDVKKRHILPTLKQLEKERDKPLPTPHKLALEIALKDAAWAMTGHGKRVAQTATNLALDTERDVVREMIAREIAGVGDVRPGKISQPNWQRLGRELYKTMKTTDSKRDWDRLAATEIWRALNFGRLMDMKLKGFEYVWWHVQTTACRYCKKLYLEEDGVTPRIFRLQGVLDMNIKYGGLNVGRKASLIGKHGGWYPAMALHCWCMCQIMEYTG